LRPPAQRGRIEGWLEGMKPFSLADMGDAALSPLVARELARFHALEPPLHLKEYYAEPVLWSDLSQWLVAARADPAGEAGRRLAPRDVAKLASLPLSARPTAAFLEASCERSSAPLDEAQQGAASFAFARGGFLSVEKELERARRAIERAGYPLAFCHNDALCGNLMRSHAEPDVPARVRLIDFEYGGTNYRGFDVANHFNEWAGGTLERPATLGPDEEPPPGHDGRPDYSRFPSKAQQQAFCRAYLSAGAARADGAETPSPAAQDVDDAAVEALVEEVAQFVLVNHLYWGLWAVCRAFEEGCADFDYATYAAMRIGEYYKLRVLAAE
jgi:ethanolamine kinase